MGYVLTRDGFDELIAKLGETYRIYAPVLKKGEGRFTDVDVVRYDFVASGSEMELEKKSDYPAKEILSPLSETLFYFTEDSVKEADIDPRDVIVFLRACDLHGVRRLDQIYLDNGLSKDYFYKRIRDHVHFALIGCTKSFASCFCVDMGTNVAPVSWMFSVEEDGDQIRSAVAEKDLEPLFAACAAKEEDVTPASVTENEVHVTRPETVPNAIYRSDMWNEYTDRCIECGRCTIACPTCSCYTMQDVFYTENGRVGERRRVQASCMIDGYSDVAGGGSYRKTAGERMRFKVLHKVYDFRRRFGYDMCVGCGRCDDICPEYISFAACVNKLNDACEAYEKEEEAEKNA